MKRVTRTIQCPVERHLVNGEEVTNAFPGANIPIIHQFMEAAGITDYVVGYMPITYALNEEDFIDMAGLITDIKKGKIYATRNECPTTTAKSKSDKTAG